MENLSLFFNVWALIQVVTVLHGAAFHADFTLVTDTRIPVHTMDRGSFVILLYTQNDLTQEWTPDVHVSTKSFTLQV